MNKYFVNKTKYEKNQQIVEPFGKLYIKNLHDNLIDRNE